MVKIRNTFLIKKIDKIISQATIKGVLESQRKRVWSWTCIIEKVNEDNACNDRNQLDKVGVNHDSFNIKLDYNYDLKPKPYM